MRSPAAERARRHRRRQRFGIRVVAVPVPEHATIAALLDRGLISERDALDPACVGEALGRVLTSWAAAKIP